MIGLKLVCNAAHAYLAKAKQRRKPHVTSDEQPPSIALLPAAIAAVLAAIGVAGMVFLFVSARQQISDGNVGMKSADAAYRAGATITPTTPNSARPSNSIPSRSSMAAGEVRKDL